MGDDLLVIFYHRWLAAKQDSCDPSPFAKAVRALSNEPHAHHTLGLPLTGLKQYKAAENRPLFEQLALGALSSLGSGFAISGMFLSSFGWCNWWSPDNGHFAYLE